MTPYLYFLLYDRWIVAQETKDYRFAHIVCTLHNINRGKDDKAHKIEEFLPDRRGKGKGKGAHQSVADQMALAKAITLAYGGRVVDKMKKVPTK